MWQGIYLTEIRLPLEHCNQFKALLVAERKITAHGFSMAARYFVAIFSFH
jgi:hypothetical protein